MRSVDLLELQNGALIAKSKLEEWQEGFGGDGVGSWKYFKLDMMELAQSQLEAGYFNLAESTINKFRASDTEGRYFKASDRALFLSKRALARLRFS